MRRFLVVLAACGGTAPPVASPPAGSEPRAVRTHAADRPAVDPIAVLAPTADGDVSWLVPGRVQLELGATPIEGPGGNRPLEVAIIDTQGNLARVAVRLDHARFSLWTEKARLLAVIAKETRVVTGIGGGMPSEMSVSLRPGARVRKLGHKDGTTQIRYVGAVEVDGWIADGALADAAPHRDPVGRMPTGRKTMMVTPGAVIRAEPKWAGQQLATMANGYFLDAIRDVDDAWTEVGYADGEVTVHGYVSRRDPPGRVHRTRDPDTPPPTITPNTKVASGTCLYTRPSGEMVGYVVGDRDVQLDDIGNGWWSLAIDTPWGPIVFAARGPMEASLVACAPAGTVPPPAGSAAPPPPPPKSIP